MNGAVSGLRAEDDALPAEAAASRRTLDVFVHLAHGFDARTWERAWRAGTLIGFNMRTPYGYHLADDMGCRVTFSEDALEGPLRRGFRLGLRALLGFDLVHAWRNRARAARAEVIWTHTESQFLAWALLLSLTRNMRRTRLIGQAVWLIDRWDRLTIVHRMSYRWLMRRVDLLTLHSPSNLARARSIFPQVRSELVLYGISTDAKRPARDAPPDRTLRVISVGNDQHRDWDTLLAALGGRQDCSLRIVSAVLKPGQARSYPNVEIGPLSRNGELHDLYGEADLAIVPLKPNLHASGITAIQEAALAGLPIVASDTGGLRAYFSDEAVRYVPGGDPSVLASAVQELVADPYRRRRLAQNASARMSPSGLSAEAYIRRHVELSWELVGCEALSA